MNAQQQQVVLPPLPVPFSSTWGHQELFKVRRELEKVKAKIADPRPCMIRKRPQFDARKMFLEAQQVQIMTALGL